MKVFQSEKIKDDKLQNSWKIERRFKMDTAKVIQVIETTLTRRGDGANTPIRIITQYWSLDGKLLTEIDPNLCDKCPGTKMYSEGED